MRLAPMPQTLVELRQVLARERRSDDRREENFDTRVFQYERRSTDRRLGGLWIDEEMILDSEDVTESLDKIAEQLDAADSTDSATEELTQILEIPPAMLR